MPSNSPYKWVSRGSGPWSFQQQVANRPYLAARRIQARFRGARTRTRFAAVIRNYSKNRRF